MRGRLRGWFQLCQQSQRWVGIVTTLVICHSGSDIRALNHERNNTLDWDTGRKCRWAKFLHSEVGAPQMGSQMLPKTRDIWENFHMCKIAACTKQMATWFKLTSWHVSFTAWTLNMVLSRTDLSGQQHRLCKWQCKEKKNLISGDLGFAQLGFNNSRATFVWKL